MKDTFNQEEIAQFVVANYAEAKKWDFNQLRNWIAWSIKEDFCLVVADYNPFAISGVVMARPTMNPQECISTLAFDQEGDTIFIDLAVSNLPKREAAQCFGLAVLERFGERDKLAWQYHGNGPLLVSDMHRHRRKLLREVKNAR